MQGAVRTATPCTMYFKIVSAVKDRDDAMLFMADLRIVDVLDHGNNGLLGRFFLEHICILVLELVHTHTRDIFVFSPCFVLPLQPHISVLFSHLLSLQTTPEPEEGIL